jgi:hypothetical protein
MRLRSPEDGSVPRIDMTERYPSWQGGAFVACRWGGCPHKGVKLRYYILVTVLTNLRHQTTS